MNNSLQPVAIRREAVLVDRFQTASRLLGAAVALAASLVLVGWIYDIDVLKSVSPKWVAMKANSALMFIFAGVALALQGHVDRRRVLLIARICAAITVLGGLLTLFRDFSHYNLGIDQLLLSEPDTALWTMHAGRMSQVTALNLVLIGVALLLLPLETGHRYRPSRWLVLPVLVTSLLGLLGYLYGVKWLYGIPHCTPMALYTP